MRKFPDQSVDLIYADPPFFSNRHYEVIWGDGYELRAFEDRWKGGINNYAAWMVERLRECRRVLKETGSMYLHCDWHASHYLRIEMDRLFGENNFRSEIVWRRQTAHSDSKQGAKNYGHVHDVILFYTASDDYGWNVQFTPYDESYKDNFYKYTEPGTGRRYRLGDLTAAKEGGDTLYEWHGVKPYKGRYWAYSKKKMEQMEKEGRLVYSKSGMPQYKRYLDEMKGVTLQDVWTDIKPAGIGKEALGYPTQKPELLLDRIIQSSSNPMDIVLDPFCGCGTALAESQKLGRRWIGVDVSPSACNLVASRMRKLGARKFALMGMPMSDDDLRKLDHFEFQNWVVQRLFGRVSARKSSDMGIDGSTFEGYPIQVKQSDDIGRNVVDNFETAMRRTKAKNGVIVAFSFGRGAHEEVARARLQDGLEIKLLTVSEMIGDMSERNAILTTREPESRP